MNTFNFGKPVIGLCMMALAATSFAAELNVPNSFTNGEVADADEVNENFSTVMTEIDGRIGDCKWSLLSPVDYNNTHNGGWVRLEGQDVSTDRIYTEFGISTLPDMVGSSSFLRQQGSATGPLLSSQADATARNGLSASSSTNSHSHALANGTAGGGSYAIWYAGGGINLEYGIGQTSSASHNHQINIGSGDSETRPTNIALNLYCRVN